MQKREQQKEEGGEASSLLARSSTMSQQNKATDEAGPHNRPFTVQEILFLTRALLHLTQLVLLSTGRD